MDLIAAISAVPNVPADLPALTVRLREPATRAVRLCAVGDIGLSGRASMTARSGAAAHLFGDVGCVLRQADVTFGNLESPLAEEIAPGRNFAAPLAGATTLREAGFTLLHLANNHVGEYGQAGLAATLAAVQKAGLQPLGAGGSMTAARELIRTDRDGLRIGWLGCGRTLLPQSGTGECYWEFDEDELLARVADARPKVDVLIVSIHIGLMYVSYPRPEHKDMAERLMAAGVHLILMHHAHVLQGLQVSAGGSVCCFNLGNFLYDWEEGNVKMPVVLDEQNEGAIFVFDLDKHGVHALTILPTVIDGHCCARWATGDRGHRILNRLEEISKNLETDFRAVFEQQRALRNTAGMVRVLVFHARRGHWRFLADSARRARWEHFRMAMRWLSARLKASYS